MQVGSLGWWAVARGVAPVYPPMPRTGLFRLCRQPIYVAFALTLWTVPLWTPDQLVVASVLTLYCLIGPLFKEARFRRLFGARFIAYQASVPYWLPWPRPGGTAPRRRNDLTIYDDDAAGWWDGSVRWRRQLRKLVPARMAYIDGLVPDWRGRRVLDLGCGGGYMAEALAARGAEVVGVDPSAPAIAAGARPCSWGRACDRLPGRGRRGDAGRDADRWTSWFASTSSNTSPTSTRCWPRLTRVLSPGGLFVFDTINRTWVAALRHGHHRRDDAAPAAAGHPRSRAIHPPGGSWKALLAAHGFTPSPFVGFGPRGLDRQGDFRVRPAARLGGHVHRAMPTAASGGGVAVSRSRARSRLGSAGRTRGRADERHGRYGSQGQHRDQGPGLVDRRSSAARSTKWVSAAWVSASSGAVPRLRNRLSGMPMRTAVWASPASKALADPVCDGRRPGRRSRNRSAPSPTAPPRLRIRLNKPLASGTRASGEVAQGEPGRRQQAEHDRHAADDLRPEHLVVVGGAVLDRRSARGRRRTARSRTGRGDGRRSAVRARPRAARCNSCATPVTSMISPISSGSWPRTRARKTGMR